MLVVIRLFVTYLLLFLFQVCRPRTDCDPARAGPAPAVFAYDYPLQFKFSTTDSVLLLLRFLLSCLYVSFVMVAYALRLVMTCVLLFLCCVQPCIGRRYSCRRRRVTTGIDTSARATAS
jgi:hypothetical protein